MRTFAADYQANSNETIPRPTQPYPHRGGTQGGPHGDGHHQRVRPSDAIQPRRRFPLPDDQEAPSEVHHLRTAVVPARRHQRALPSGAWRPHLERMGRS